ncbi:MAG TPA: hypothetical protein VEO53_18470, partial [Candidatus Binatia bacterium]|nr:hypothetical protein [Candidatus Binatia bacterium]
DVIPEEDPTANNRVEFLRHVIEFLAPGHGGVGSIALDQSNYRLPDRVTLEVADSDLTGLRSATVSVYSSSFPGHIPVTLRETTEPGVFRGFVSLVATPSGQDQVGASHGDTIYAEYLDDSAGGLGQASRVATALVDAQPPDITNVAVTAMFQNATIAWETSEPTDMLVQFGESVLLGRSVYESELRTSHVVEITGLVPDRAYYFKLVSRDDAGNATVDDNNGHLYVFSTRPPLGTPFLGNMDGNETNWSVFNREGTQYRWQLGQPHNALVAHTLSGLDGWGSDLLGDEASDIDTSLVSPAIELTGGNVATLKFTSAYDFTKLIGADVVSHGQLLLVTNPANPPLLLREYTGRSPFRNGSYWNEEEIDLTPYLGEIIFLVWRHELHSIRVASRCGWALDGVCVTVEDLPPGTIQITNNLAQARVTLTGPANRVAHGYFGCFSNLPPGLYVITWNGVPYYQAPPPQTNLLAPDGLLMLAGEYTFPDANTNGISDWWELQFFGSVSTNRTGLTDTDHDLFTDYAEFVAGTNPTQANSNLRLLTPVVQTNITSVRTNITLTLRWPSTPGRVYQLQGASGNLRNWAPFSFGGNYWLQATTATFSATISAPDASEPYLFRIEVRP